jgi:transcription initiation factor TFIIF subunit beta
MPRNQLLDLLFGLFEQQPSWSFKDLRAKTEQPADYLKEVLADVAMIHRSGELNGQYTLQDTFKNGDRASTFGLVLRHNTKRL